MTFSLQTDNGFEYIEQTGTDTDLSGLSPFTQYLVPPVTNLGFALGWTGQEIYFIQRPILIRGSVTFDPSEQSLVVGNLFQNNPSTYNYALRVTGSSGSLTAGVQQGTNVDGSPRYSSGVGIVIGNDYQLPGDALGTVTREGMLVDDGGVLTVNGSELQFASPLKIATDAGICTFNGTRIVDITSFFLGKQTIRNEAESSVLRLNDVEFDAKEVAQRFINLGGIDTFSGFFKNSYIQPHRAEPGVAAPSGTVTLENVSFGSNFNTFDYQLVGGSSTPSDNQAVELTNVDIGTGVRTNHVAPSAINHLAVFQKIRVEVQDTAFQAIQDCKVRIPTTDSGNRDNGSIGGEFIGNRDFSGTTYALYSDTTDSSGFTPELAVLTGRIYDDNLSGTFLEYDLYGKSQVAGEDKFDVQFVSYPHTLAIQELELKRPSTIELLRVLTPDASVTETDKAAVDAYTRIDTPEKFYDRAKSFLYDNYAGESTVLVSRNGSQIDAGSFDIDIDSDATDVFSFDGSKITIKASLFTGSLVTTGVITLLNDAEFLGTRTDTFGTVIVTTLTLTGLQENSEIRVYGAGTTTELAGVEDSGTTFTANISNSISDDSYKLTYSSFIQSLDISGEEGTITGLAFNTDGAKMFVLGAVGDEIIEYNLSAAFDISTAVESQTFSVRDQDEQPRDLAFSPDGTKVFVVGRVNHNVSQYELTSAFDISTASHIRDFNVETEEETPEGIAFSTDGAKMFIVGTVSDAVQEYDLSVAFDISTAVASQSFDVSEEDTNPLGMAFNPDGTKMFVVGSVQDEVQMYRLSTGFDVSTAVFEESADIEEQVTGPTCVTFNASGTRMFVGGQNNDIVAEYSSEGLLPSADIVIHSLGFEYQKIEGADISSNLTLPIQQRTDRTYAND